MITTDSPAITARTIVVDMGSRRNTRTTTSATKTHVPMMRTTRTQRGARRVTKYDRRSIRGPRDSGVMGLRLFRFWFGAIGAIVSTPVVIVAWRRGQVSAEGAIVTIFAIWLSFCLWAWLAVDHMRTRQEVKAQETQSRQRSRLWSADEVAGRMQEPPFDPFPNPLAPPASDARRRGD